MNAVVRCALCSCMHVCACVCVVCMHGVCVCVLACVCVVCMHVVCVCVCVPDRENSSMVVKLT